MDTLIVTAKTARGNQLKTRSSPGQSVSQRAQTRTTQCLDSYTKEIFSYSPYVLDFLGGSMAFPFYFSTHLSLLFTH